MIVLFQTYVSLCDCLSYLNDLWACYIDHNGRVSNPVCVVYKYNLLETDKISRPQQEGFNFLFTLLCMQDDLGAICYNRRKCKDSPCLLQFVFFQRFLTGINLSLLFTMEAFPHQKFRLNKQWLQLALVRFCCIQITSLVCRFSYRKTI